MSRWKCLVLFLGATAVVLLLSITLFFPFVIDEYAKSWVRQNTDRTLTIGGINVNPIGLTIQINDLALSEAGQKTTFVSWDSLEVSFSTRSLVQLALIIDKFHLEKPSLNIERFDSHRFNFSDLIPESDTSPQFDQGRESRPFRFSVNNLTINEGRIHFTDRSLTEFSHHEVYDIKLAIPAIGNLPYLVDHPIQPLLQANLNGSPFELKGEASPFSADKEIRFKLAIDNIDLPFYQAYLPMELPFSLRNGSISFDLDLLYQVQAETGPALELSGQLALTTLDIFDLRDQRLFFLPLMQIKILPSHPLTRSVHLGGIQIYNLEVYLDRDQQGVWNHSRLKMAESAEPEDEGMRDSDGDFNVQIDKVEVRDGVVFFRDEWPKNSFETTVKEINIDLQDFSLSAPEPMPLDVQLKTEHKETARISGHFLLDPFKLDLHAELHNLLVGAYAPYYQQAYAGPLGGTMNLQARIESKPEQPLLISQGNIQWENAYMAFDDSDGLGVDLVQVRDLSYDLAKNRLDVASYRGINGRVKFSRDKTAHWTLASRNFPILKKLTEAPDEAISSPSATVHPEFSYHLGELAFDNWTFDIKDWVPSTPVHLQAHDFNLIIRNLAAPERVQSPFTFSSGFGRKGRVQIDGIGSLAAQTATLNGRMRNIALATFAPYLAEYTNLVLKSGFLNAELQCSTDLKKSPLKVLLQGDIGIRSLHLLDSFHREDLLKWDNLQVAKIKVQANPTNLSIGSITLSDYFVKILIDENAHFNLSEAFSLRGQMDKEISKAEHEAAVQKPKQDPTSEIQVETVVLQGGHIDYTDRNLWRVFHTDMQELGGRITGLSSEPETLAEVDLRGSLRNHSPLSIEGVVNPLIKEPYVDLRLSFYDIDMSPISPYSGTYVGYLIEKGKLNLALDYSIEENRLKATNEVFLDQFTFGDPVESERATSLPVKLAVALLKDRNGEIHLDIPVNGSLDDPEFSVFGVVWTIIKNLLVKVATSPLSLLGALLGESDENFSNVHFAYGSARIPDPEKDKLRKIAQALIDRPDLNLEISGYIDPENDAEGYRREQLRQKIYAMKYQQFDDSNQLSEETAPDNIKVTDDEYPDLLWRVYKETDFPKPRNFFGMIKKLPPSEMEKLIYTNSIVDNEDLTRLAQTRAQAVQSFLTEEGGLLKERVFLLSPEISRKPADEGVVRSRVEFGVNVK